MAERATGAGNNGDGSAAGGHANNQNQGFIARGFRRSENAHARVLGPSRRHVVAATGAQLLVAGHRLGIKAKDLDDQSDSLQGVNFLPLDCIGTIELDFRWLEESRVKRSRNANI